MGIFPDTQGQLTPLSDLAEFRTNLRCYGCPNCLQEWRRSDENKGTRVFITLNINFSDAQWQIALELVMVSGRNLKPRAGHSIYSLEGYFHSIKQAHVYPRLGSNLRAPEQTRLLRLSYGCGTHPSIHACPRYLQECRSRLVTAFFPL